MSTRSADQTPSIRFLNAGDTAVIAEFGDTIDKQWVAAVTNLRAHIQSLQDQGYLPGVEETVPTFRSLAIVIDPLVTSVEEVRTTLEATPMPNGADVLEHATAWRLPVCYDSTFGIDLESVAIATDLSVEEIIHIHLNEHYQVYTLGFQPGYGFLGDTDERIRLPRRSEPRIKIPAGSVAIAMKLTCVYPWDSPGGWHLLGRCPVAMFNANATPPALLSPGDTLCFERIDKHAFNALEADQRRGTVNWSHWQDKTLAS